jgi:hypothetical protein
MSILNEAATAAAELSLRIPSIHRTIDYVEESLEILRMAAANGPADRDWRAIRGELVRLATLAAATAQALELQTEADAIDKEIPF